MLFPINKNIYLRSNEKKNCIIVQELQVYVRESHASTFFFFLALPSTSLGCSSTSSTPPERQYLHAFLRDQRIWRSQRFWHAAFFDALQTERARGNSTRDGVSCLAMDSVDEQRFAENVAFGQLGYKKKDIFFIL